MTEVEHGGEKFPAEEFGLTSSSQVSFTKRLQVSVLFWELAVQKLLRKNCSQFPPIKIRL